MKRRIMAALLCVLLLAQLFPTPAGAADVVASGTCGAAGNEANVTWTLDSDGVLTINGTGAMMVYGAGTPPWPSLSVKTIIINEGVTDTGECTFPDCTNLTSVTIPVSVTYIGDMSFELCTKLTDVYYNGTQAQWEAVQIIEDGNNPILNASIHYGNSGSPPSGGETGQDDSGITASGTCGAAGNEENVTWTLYTDGRFVVRGLGVMANYKFSDSQSASNTPWYQYRESIMTARIESGVTTIGIWAFGNCINLTSVTIPDSVTSLGDEAFANCGLTSVTIPNSVTSIGDHVFSGCISLTSIVIPGSVTSIGDNAFYGCTSLTSVTIPDSVTSLGNQAFSRCTSLTSVTIPHSVTSIGSWMFSYCINLTSVTIPDSVTSIGLNAFSSCTSLTSINIPDSVTSIGVTAFASCTSLKIVSIPNSVVSIGVSAFQHCTSLTSVIIVSVASEGV